MIEMSLVQDAVDLEMISVRSVQKDFKIAQGDAYGF
jgi:hypothetical protein